MSVEVGDYMSEGMSSCCSAGVIDPSGEGIEGVCVDCKEHCGIITSNTKNEPTCDKIILDRVTDVGACCDCGMDEWYKWEDLAKCLWCSGTKSLPQKDKTTCDCLVTVFGHDVDCNKRGEE